ncbi:MAG: LuxR C-terminal-related transcriptional regulator, partial [Acidimicrobiia bacterium]
LQLAAEADLRFLSDDEFTARQAPDHDNLRGALEWALAGEDLDAAIPLLLGLSNLWLSRGLLREASVWFDRVLGHPGMTTSPLRYRALCARGVVAIIDGQPDPTLLMAGEMAEEARAVGDHRYLARGLAVHGTTQLMLDPAAGEKILHDAVALADDAGDSFSSVWARLALMVAAIHREDHHLLARHLEESRPTFDGATAQMRSMYHGLAGFSDVRAGRFDAARSHGMSARQLAAEAGDPTLAGAMAELTLGLLELAEGRIDAAAEVLEQILREPRASGPTREDPLLTGAWGRVLAARGDVDGAEAMLAEAVRLAAGNGDGIQYGLCLGWHLSLLRFRGDGTRVRTLAGELRNHARQQGHPGFEALALRELGHLARLDGELEVADDLAHRALAAAAGAGILPDVVLDLVAVAGIAAAGESGEEAVRLLGAADALRRRIGFVLPSWDEPAADADLGLARSALGPEAFEAAWAEGQALGVEEAVAYAERGRGERKRPSAGWASLTPTERQVVDLLAQGLRNAEIAERLFVAPSTVKTHLGHVFAKLGVSTRAELAALAARRA